jgi:lycopene cyclase domain-containing protein
MGKWTYALLLIGSILIPLLRSFETRVRFYEKWKPLFIGILVMMLIFIPWDILFTRLSVWKL